MSDKDYYSFDEVLNDLRMEEDELKRLVSAGEIRAFRDQDTMKFKAEDVVRLRAPDGSEIEELDLGDDLELEGDDLLDDDLELDAGGDVEEIDLAAEAASSGGPRKRGGRGGAARESSGGGVKAQKRSARQAAAADEADEGMGIKFGLILVTIVLLFGAMTTVDAVKGSPSNGLTGAIANIFKN